MNIIGNLVNAIKQDIPKAILKDALTYDVNQHRPYSFDPRSIDAYIEEKIINDIVVRDLDQYSGTYTYIPLNNAAEIQEEYDPSLGYRTYYRFDKDTLGGSIIIDVLELSFTYGYRGQYASVGTPVGLPTTGMVNRAAGMISDVISPTPNMTSSRIERVSGTTIMIEGRMPRTIYGHVHVALSNPNVLTNIKPTTTPILRKFCVLAAKKFIYNTLVVEVDMGRIHAGNELGTYRDVLNSYESAEQEYRELLDTKAHKLMIFNSSESMTNYVRSMLGGRR